MYVYRNISPAIILRFAWANLLFFGLYSGVLVYIDHAAEHIGEKFHIPFVPLSVIGIAVAFYLGFKNNASFFGRFARGWSNPTDANATLALSIDRGMWGGLPLPPSTHDRAGLHLHGGLGA